MIRTLTAMVIGGFIGGYSGAHGWFPLGVLLCAAAGAVVGFLPNPFRTGRTGE